MSQKYIKVNAKISLSVGILQHLHNTMYIYIAPRASSLLDRNSHGPRANSH